MLYENLPGIELTVKDGNLVLPAESMGTATVLIIAPVTETGRANTATVDCNPKRIQGSEDFVKYALGTFNKDNPLAKAWKQTFDGGCRNIYCLELRGTTHEERYANLHTIYSVLEDNFRVDEILLSGVKADDAITTATVVLDAPREDYGAGVATVKDTGVIDTFDSTDGKNLILTSPCIASTVVVKSQVDTDPAVTMVPGEDYTFDSDSRTVKLTAVAGATEEITVEYDTYDYSYPNQLAGYCNVVSTKNNQIIGIMALKPAADRDLSTIKAYVDGQVTQKYSSNLQIVGGATQFFEIANEPYESDFAGAYAGLISMLPSYSSPTSKVIPGVVFPSYNLSPTQIKALTNKHIVVPRSRNGRVVISDAITTAADNSDYVRLSTLRITNDAVNLVREISEPYIGEPNTLARRNGLETALRTALTGMIKRGALNDYRLVIKSSTADQIDGNMRIGLDLVPVFETRRIIITVALKPTL